jgi:hypothetical protein
MLIRDPGWKKFGSGMENSRIRDKHPGSATLIHSVLSAVIPLKIKDYSTRPGGEGAQDGCVAVGGCAE